MRLGLILGILKKLFDQLVLSECTKMNGNEGKVLLLILPEIMISSIKILRTLVLICKKSIVLLLPNILDIIQIVLADLRYFTESFSALKIQAYKLLCDVCDIFGANSSLEARHKDLVTYLLSDIVPPQG